jgi:hypothetical protein
VRAAAGPALPVALAVAVTAAAATGCDDGWTALLDSLPIALTRAPVGDPAGTANGALVATAAVHGARDRSFPMLIGTGTPTTLLNGPLPFGTPATEKAAFELLDPQSVAADPTNPHVRGSFHNVSILRLPLLAIGDGTLAPGGILGGDILRRFSVDIRFGATCPNATGTGSEICSAMTFWNHLGADLGYLQDSGYAVLRFSLFGGGEVTALGDPDFIGERGPLVLASTRIVLRACAVPDAFDPTAPRVQCCKEADAVRLASGIDLALMVDTGVGPLVLSEAAWIRIKARLATTPTPAVETPGGPLQIATWPEAIPTVTWSTIPRYALVDLETGAATDPGPCVELGRARRIERVSVQIASDIALGVAPTACTEPCDNDVREPDKSQNSAAYLELAGPQTPIPVAVIRDDEAYLQGLRFDIRPEGPELDGVIGAAALGRARLEIDYVSGPSRAVFSCEPGVPREECWAAARCPRLPDASYRHLCFGLASHGLAPSCAPSGC